MVVLVVVNLDNHSHFVLKMVFVKGAFHIQMAVPLKILKVAILHHCKCEIPWLMVPGQQEFYFC